ncbi:MAG: molecular chaperone TorD family protein [Anaerolineales bacterium]|nr:molecular chaperone TorD family protein [Anaerolineales bacterium]
MFDAPPVTLQPTDPAVLAGHALALNLIGKLLYAPPEPEALRALAAEGVFAELPFDSDRPAVTDGLACLQRWADSHLAGDAAAGFAAVRADFTRLFEGPGRVLAAPWESVQRNGDHLLFQTETLQVRTWYRRFGLQLTRLHQEPDDHVGLELAFVSHLAQLALAAHAAGDAARWAELIEAQAVFLRTHPQRWVPAWSALVITEARTDYYRGLAHLAGGVLAELEAALSAWPPAKAAA